MPNVALSTKCTLRLVVRLHEWCHWRRVIRKEASENKSQTYIQSSQSHKFYGFKNKK